jgi:imidazolonepropionase-like amidohydrolase
MMKGKGQIPSGDIKVRGPEGLILRCFRDLKNTGGKMSEARKDQLDCEINRINQNQKMNQERVEVRGDEKMLNINMKTKMLMKEKTKMMAKITAETETEAKTAIDIERRSKKESGQVGQGASWDEGRLRNGVKLKSKVQSYLKRAGKSAGVLALFIGTMAMAVSLATRTGLPGQAWLGLLNPELQAAPTAGRCFNPQAEKPKLLVIKAGKILTMAGPPIEQGIVIVEGDKIKAVGKELAIPEGAEIIEEPEGWVLPGLIDVHSSLGLVDERGQSENEELSEPNVAQLDVLDGFYPFDRRIAQARASGITAALICPGRRSVIGGQAAVVRLKGQTVDEMKILAPAGVKFSIGEGPKQAFGSKGRLPSTRMGNIYVIRQALLEAREYADQWAAYNDSLAKAKKEKKSATTIQPPRRDLKLEALAKVVRGELPAFIECYRIDDISGAIRLVDEFKLKAVFIGCAEGYLVAGEISKRGIPVIVGPMGIGPKRTETENVAISNAARLHKAGVKIALESETQYGLAALEELPLVAALAVRGGLSEEEALKAITINAAEIIGAGDKIGSLEPGKQADLVIFSGNPLDYQTRVKKVIMGT